MYFAIVYCFGCFYVVMVSFAVKISCVETLNRVETLNFVEIVIFGVSVDCVENSICFVIVEDFCVSFVILVVVDFEVKEDFDFLEDIVVVCLD